MWRSKKLKVSFLKFQTRNRKLVFFHQESYRSVTLTVLSNKSSDPITQQCLGTKIKSNLHVLQGHPPAPNTQGFGYYFCSLVGIFLVVVFGLVCFFDFFPYLTAETRNNLSCPLLSRDKLFIFYISLKYFEMYCG